MLTEAVIVTPTDVIDRGSVVIEDGCIVDITSRALAAGPGTFDLRGRMVLPGLVDLHNDAIEVELNPRPGAHFAPMFGLLHLDRTLAAAGVTTQFHALYFSDDLGRRSIAQATAVSAAIDVLRQDGGGAIDHHAMLRLDLRAEGGLDAIRTSLPLCPIPLVSLNDHVPGQGQYRDPEAYRRFLAGELGNQADVAAIDAALLADGERAARTEQTAMDTLRRVSDLRRQRDVILVSHDDDTPERVNLMYDLGCRIAEFPLTLDAAAQAKALGMQIVMGAANVYRGGSTSGNVGALELLAHRLVDILVADYSAPTLLAALFRLAASGVVDLPTAAGLLTRNPAMAVGLHDRGAIHCGLRADFVVVEERLGTPLAVAVMVAGQWRYSTGIGLA
jgi:alpha-D-ribose 1-methylphosphonate 5-triphosphate diphosphatase